MMQLEARHIRKATVNGSKVQLFELWKGNGESWTYYGLYSAPQTMPKSGLVGLAMEVLENAEMGRD